MNSAIAILTYRRLSALQTTLEGLRQHCGQYPLAIFEDLGQRDATEDYLNPSGKRIWRKELEAEQCLLPEPLQGDGSWKAFLGTRNLGVSGNSNRAIKWFLEETDCDHLCLLNDDLHVLGDFVNFYGLGHADLSVGLWCFCDFASNDYKWVTVRLRGYGVKLLPRLTGIMMSFTRKCLEKVGYYDMRFSKWGQEHCDVTYRARFASQVQLEGQDQNGLDLEHALLRHQEVATSMPGIEGDRAQKEAWEVMQTVSAGYRNGSSPIYVPFRLSWPKTAGGFRANGMRTDLLLDMDYQLVNDHVDSVPPQ